MFEFLSRLFRPTESPKQTEQSSPTEPPQPTSAERGKKLLALGMELIYLGPDYYDKKNRERIREIGQELHNLGGMALMLGLHEQVVKVHGPIAARKLESRWNGVGDWRH